MNHVLGSMVLLFCLIPSSSAAAQTAPAQVPPDTFLAWMERVSNAGRWGPEDQLGTLNLITAEKRRSAAKTVQDGITISLAHHLVPGADSTRFFPLRLRLAVRSFGSTLVATDSLWFAAHGFVYSHIDALSHIGFRGHLYNGFQHHQLLPDGARRLGVEGMQGGIVTRGVIIDMPKLKKLAFLPSGTAVTVEDLEAWERRHRTRIEPGDVVLIRTGRAARAAADPAWRVSADASGPHPAVALWLKERGAAALGSDVANEASPSVVQGIGIPMHLLSIVAMGMPLFDNLNLEEVAAEAATRSRSTFLFVATPLPLRGGTGSAVNPIAIF